MLKIERKEAVIHRLQWCPGCHENGWDGKHICPQCSFIVTSQVQRIMDRYVARHDTETQRQWSDLFGLVKYYCGSDSPFGPIPNAWPTSIQGKNPVLFDVEWVWHRNKPEARFTRVKVNEGLLMAEMLTIVARHLVREKHGIQSPSDHYEATEAKMDYLVHAAYLANI
jgi:hypothetical protein